MPDIAHILLPVDASPLSAHLPARPVEVQCDGVNVGHLARLRRAGARWEATVLLQVGAIVPACPEGATFEHDGGRVSSLAVSATGAVRPPQPPISEPKRKISALADEAMTPEWRTVRDRLKALAHGYYLRTSDYCRPLDLRPEIELRPGEPDAVRYERRPHPDCPGNRRRHAICAVLSTDPARVARAWVDIGQECVDAVIVTSAERASGIVGRDVWRVDGLRQGEPGRAVRFLVRALDGTVVVTKSPRGLPGALRRYESACDEDWRTARIVRRGSWDGPVYVPAEISVTNVRASRHGITVVGQRGRGLVRGEWAVDRAEDGTWIVTAVMQDGPRERALLIEYEAWSRRQREAEAAAAAMPDEDEEALAALG